MNRLLLILILLTGLLGIIPQTEALAVGPSSLTIGRMKVTIMPEYDSQQVLVIYEGRFKDKNAFPTEALFTLPKGVTRLTDVCSLSPGGQHFCQLYKITQKKDRSETLVKLPYSDFFVDFQYAPFTPTPNEPRDFTFTLNLAYPADILEVHIQEPYRASGFRVSPASEDRYEKREFTYYRYKMKGLKKGESLKFEISYNKEDVKPSVDAKFSSMASPNLVKEGRGTVMLIVGLVILLVLASMRFIKGHF